MSSYKQISFKQLHESGYWQQLALTEMDQQQWEALCDGCGKCCLIKLQDEDTDEIYYTNVACQYLDERKCRCQCYQQRQQKVAACLKLSADQLDSVDWLPATCAYRLLAEGKSLPNWHPLITGDPFSTRKAGASVARKVLNELLVPEQALEDHIIDWIDLDLSEIVRVK